MMHKTLKTGFFSTIPKFKITDRVIAVCLFLFAAFLDAIVETKGYAIELQFGASLSKTRQRPWRFRERASELPFSIRFND